MKRLVSALPQSVRTALKRIDFHLRQRGFTPYLRRKNLDGTVFDFWIADTDARDWYDRTDRLTIELRFTRDHLIGAGDVVFDCGAHHGRSAILFSRWVGERGVVIAFEPRPRNADILLKNLVLNGITNVRVERKAVGASSGRIRIDGVSDSTVIFSNQGVEVEVARLDDYASLKPAFVKIDVEGFEYQVLQGARQVLSRRPKLAVEIHGDKLTKYGSSLPDILDAIGLDGYDAWIQWKDSDEPVRYGGEPVAGRVHMFFIPSK